MIGITYPLMPNKRLPTYLRTHRLAWGLHQRELGNLVGLSRDAISKCELGKRLPNARLIVAVEIVFGKSAAEVFPEFYDRVVDRIGAQGLALGRRLEGADDKRSMKVQKFLSAIPARIRADDHV